MDKKIQALIREREKSLLNRPVQDIAGILGALSKKWMDPSFAYRKKAVERLTKASYFTPAMAEQALNAIFSELTSSKLLRLLDSEIGDHKRIDAFQANGIPGRKTFAVGPRVIFHSFASNVPNPAIWSFVMGMLVKAVNIGRVSRRDGGILDIYLDSLRRVDRRLAKTNVLVASKAEVRRLLSQVDLVVAYGSEETLRHLKQNTKNKFMGYGHKISISAITKESLSKRNLQSLAKLTAKDVWMCDRRGCLSPATVFVEEGGEVSPQAFAQALAAALEGFSKKTASPAIHERFRQHLQIRGIKGDAYSEIKTRSGWVVMHDASDKFMPTPEYCISVKSLKRFENLFSLIRPFSSYLQAVSLEATAAQRERLSRRLAAAGFNRITRAGKLQFPPLDWHHDGGMNLAGWVKWTDLEP